MPRRGSVFIDFYAHKLEFICAKVRSLGPLESFGNAIVRELLYVETVLISQFQHVTFA